VAIPDFQSIMVPLLDAHLDGQEHRNRDLVKVLAERFGLTDKERREMLPSGRAKLFDNRVGWAKTHITQAGLLASPRRAISVITPLGREVLQRHPDRVDLAILKQYPAYRAFREKRSLNGGGDGVQGDALAADTPEEALDKAYIKARSEVEAELLRRVIESPPEFLEQVVVDLVVQMGYGGSRRDAGEALGKSGDGGVDGIIKEDPLGLDAIYLQAKRWENVVGRPEIQKFAGALQGQRSRKGIFITTSSFTREALEYAGLIETKIILIDGVRLARLMFDQGIGVATESIYEVKRIDSDYFSDS
jgi:restriction system protein